jgi:uncharacterized membrane protein YgcG
MAAPSTIWPARSSIGFRHDGTFRLVNVETPAVVPGAGGSVEGGQLIRRKRRLPESILRAVSEPVLHLLQRAKTGTNALDLCCQSASKEVCLEWTCSHVGADCIRGSADVGGGSRGGDKGGGDKGGGDKGGGGGSGK